LINIIYGSKGSGKTKQIIDMANAAVESAKGSIVYITDTMNHSRSVNNGARYVITNDYDITDGKTLKGFIAGMLAGNYDIEHVFIDGAARIAKSKIAGIRPVILFMEKRADVTFTLTVSADLPDIPAFIKKHIKKT